MAKDDQHHLEPVALLERIMRLEGENQRLQKTLANLPSKADLDYLTGLHANTREALQMLTQTVTDEVGRIYSLLTERDKKHDN